MNLDLESQRNALKIAYNVASTSPDPSTQNGALLLIDDQPNMLTFACNQFPLGVAYTEERWERPLKYEFVEHAERNCVYRSARLGIATSGTTMVCPWAACADCARAIIQSDVRTLLTHKQAHDRSPARWKESIASAFTMFDEAKIEIVMFDGVVGGPPVRHTGEVWEP